MEFQHSGKIEGFTGNNEFLSNFFIAPICYEGIMYPSVEHAYHSAKTFDPKIKDEISKATTPGRAKRLGHKLELRTDWQEVQLDVMKQLLLLKFTSYEYLHTQLLATDLKLLIEGNNWHDNFWGVCVCDRCVGGSSKNHLGRLLMEVRMFLRNNLPKIPQVVAPLPQEVAKRENIDDDCPF